MLLHIDVRTHLQKITSCQVNIQYLCTSVSKMSSGNNAIRK